MTTVGDDALARLAVALDVTEELRALLRRVVEVEQEHAAEMAKLRAEIQAVLDRDT